MKYTDQEKREIFTEWMQGFLSKIKSSLMTGSSHEACTVISIPDELDPEIEGELKITVRRKQCQKNKKKS